MLQRNSGYNKIQFLNNKEEVKESAKTDTPDKKESILKKEETDLLREIRF